MDFSLHSLASPQHSVLLSNSWPALHAWCDWIQIATRNRTNTVIFFNPLEVSSGKACGNCSSDQNMFIYKWNLWLGFSPKTFGTSQDKNVFLHSNQVFLTDNIKTCKFGVTPMIIFIGCGVYKMKISLPLMRLPDQM